MGEDTNADPKQVVSLAQIEMAGVADRDGHDRPHSIF